MMNMPMNRASTLEIETIVEYAEGGLIKEHDHAFEEAFFFLGGEIEAVLDGTTYRLGPGDYCWSGVGSMHSFANPTAGPVRWGGG